MISGVGARSQLSMNISHSQTPLLEKARTPAALNDRDELRTRDGPEDLGDRFCVGENIPRTGLGRG